MWVGFLLIALYLLFGLRRVPAGQRGVVQRRGFFLQRQLGPGWIWIFPAIDRLHLVATDPFSVSLPPQSAITKDEIPIQLQASLDAKVTAPVLATAVMDWRIHIISNLQELMKDKLEELDFDRLDEVFPSWIQTIRTELSKQSAKIGVEIVELRIANLSPRTRPQNNA